MIDYDVFLKVAYDVEADSILPGLSDQLKKDPKAYEVAFNHWLNHKISTTLEQSGVKGGIDE